MNVPRPLSLVKLRPDIESHAQAKYPFIADLPLVFLGEISNMPGHGVFVGFRSGKVYSGYHIFSFVECAPDEV